MAAENVIFEKKGDIATVFINRPKALNALNTKTFQELDAVVDILEGDPEVKVVLISGKEKAFVAGADIQEMKDFSPLEAREFSNIGSVIFRKIELMKKPVIAVVNGYALGGGCELAMAADIRIASEKAKFGQPETGLGIIPGFSGNLRLPRLVGTAKAKELIFTGSIIDAQEAKRIGLVNEVYPAESLYDAAFEMAKAIIKNSAVAVSFAKTAINRSLDVGLEEGVEIEKDLFGLCFSESDQKEGMSAFIEKRKAEFK